MDVEKLIEKGFTNRQISQLIFIEEAGVNLDNIDILTPVEKLIKFKKDLAEEKFYSNQILTIRSLNDKGYNVAPLLDLSIPRDRYYKLQELIINGYDITRLANPKLPEQNFEILFNCIIQNEVQYPFLETEKIFSGQIEDCFDLLKENPSFSSIFDLDISKMRLKFAIEIALACQIAGVKFNIKEMIDEKFSDQQVMQIASLARYGINLLDYCDEKFNYEQMCAISTGLTEGVDVSIFNKLRYNASQMDVILDALCYNKDAENGEKINIDILLDSRYSAAHMQLLNQCMQEGKSIEHIANVELNFLQALEILQAQEKGYNLSLFLNNNLSGQEMHLLNVALELQNEYDIDFNILIENKYSIQEKIKYLIGLITAEYSEIDLSDKDDIDSVIAGASNIQKEFYNAFEGYIGQEYNACDGNIITEYCELPCPLSDFIHSGEDVAVDEAFAEAYYDDIEAVVKILACIDYDSVDCCYLIRNIYDGTIAAELDINDFYNGLDNVLDKQEQIIMDTMENISYNNGNDEVLLDDVLEIEKYGGPSFKKLTYLKYGYGCEYIYVLESELREIYGNVSENIDKIKKQMSDENLEYTAWCCEDTYRATYSQGKEIYEKHFYGSFDERQKLEKSFGVKILDEIEKER